MQEADQRKLSICVDVEVDEVGRARTGLGLKVPGEVVAVLPCYCPAKQF